MPVAYSVRAYRHVKSGRQPVERFSTGRVAAAGNRQAPYIGAGYLRLIAKRLVWDTVMLCPGLGGHRDSERSHD